jgi:hypothetical protein
LSIKLAAILVRHKVDLRLNRHWRGSRRAHVPDTLKCIRTAAWTLYHDNLLLWLLGFRQLRKGEAGDIVFPSRYSVGSVDTFV